jgi:hypothetical protein
MGRHSAALPTFAEDGSGAASPPGKRLRAGSGLRGGVEWGGDAAPRYHGEGLDGGRGTT